MNNREKKVAYGRSDTDKVFPIEIQQSVEVPGAQYDVLISIHRSGFNKEQLALGCSGLVDFGRSPTEEHVYLEGNFTIEELLALYLVMQEDC
jgi:hypothetical protein